MPKVELADLYNVVPSSETSSPKVTERLGAAVRTMEMKLPALRRNVWANVIGVSTGIASGETTVYLHHPSDEKGQIAQGIVIGLIAYAAPALTPLIFSPFY